MMCTLHVGNENCIQNIDRKRCKCILFEKPRSSCEVIETIKKRTIKCVDEILGSESWFN